MKIYDVVRRVTQIFYRIRYGNHQITYMQRQRLNKVINEVGQALEKTRVYRFSDRACADFSHECHHPLHRRRTHLRQRLSHEVVFGGTDSAGDDAESHRLRNLGWRVDQLLIVGHGDVRRDVASDPLPVAD